MARPVNTTTTSTTGLDTNVISNITLDGSQSVGIGFDAASTKVAGVMKVANMFFKILLTLKGSNPIDQDEGTTLVDLFDSNIADEQVLFVCVKEAVDDALAQMLTLQDASGAVEEEQIASASVVNFSFEEAEGPKVDFGVNVYNAAGDSFTLEVPSIVVS